MNRLLNFALFYLGWFACVLGAARGMLWLGPAVVAGLLLLHFSLSSNWAREARLVLAVGLLGFILDTLQASTGLYAFTRTSVAAWLCPLWMVALWMVFATTLNSSMAWLAGRFALAAGLGAIFGPASYMAGARLGAIDLPANELVSLVGIAITWAFAMPALLLLRDVLSKPAAGLPPCPCSPGWMGTRDTEALIDSRGRHTARADARNPFASDYMDPPSGQKESYP